MQYILMYLFTFLVFFIVDLLWLGIFAKKLYNQHLGFLLTDKVKWPAAIIFYLLFIFGLVYFAVAPALAGDSLSIALLNGALFGFFCYATYDLTNLATLKDWPLKITLIDLLWGTFIGALSATLAYLIVTII